MTRFEKLRPALDTLALALHPVRNAQRRRRLSRAQRADLCRALQWNGSRNIIGFAIGPKRTQNKIVAPDTCLHVLVVRKLSKRKLAAPERIPSRLDLASLGTGCATDVIELGGLPCLQSPTLQPGVDAAHYTQLHGTLTAVVHRNGTPTPLLLSCCHSFAPPFESGLEVESPPDPHASTWTNVVARVVDSEPLQIGGRRNRMDAALAEPLSGVHPDTANDIPGLGGAIVSLSNLESGDLARQEVRGFAGLGAVSGTVNGELVSEGCVIALRDDRGNVFAFEDLISYRASPATQAGDSGMPILLSVGSALELLGMHIGALGTLAFFVPIRRVVERFDLALP